MRKLRVVELYAGTARSAEAFRSWRKAQISLLVDNDPFASETYFLNHPSAPYLKRNVVQLTPSEVEASVGGKVDILLGCPPCQGFSDTGVRDPADPRNAHLTHFSAVAQALRPLAVAMENVPLAADTRRFKKFVNAMSSLGYRATWGVLNAALHGSTQCRHRLVYIGLRKDVKVEPSLPEPKYGGAGLYFSYRHNKMMKIESDPVSMLSESPGVRRVRSELPHLEEADSLGPETIPKLREVWAGLPKIGTKRAERLCHYAWEHTPKMRRRMKKVAEGGQWSGGLDHYSNSYGRLHLSGLANTLTTFFPNPGSGRYWHPTDNRAISIREAARIQGFPDSFQLLPECVRTSRLIGNALDSTLAEVSYRVIRDSLS